MGCRCVGSKENKGQSEESDQCNRTKWDLFCKPPPRVSYKQWISKYRYVKQMWKQQFQLLHLPRALLIVKKTQYNLNKMKLLKVQWKKFTLNMNFRLQISTGTSLKHTFLEQQWSEEVQVKLELSAHQHTGCIFPHISTPACYTCWTHKNAFLHTHVHLHVTPGKLTRMLFLTDIHTCMIHLLNSEKKVKWRKHKHQTPINSSPRWKRFVFTHGHYHYLPPLDHVLSVYMEVTAKLMQKLYPSEC